MNGSIGDGSPVYPGARKDRPKDMVDYLDLLQWPAMVVTVIAAWLVASQSRRKREYGFWVFLASNVLWIVWGWQDGAHALIALQVALAAMNIRGAWKNEAGAGR